MPAGNRAHPLLILWLEQFTICFTKHREDQRQAVQSYCANDTKQSGTSIFLFLYPHFMVSFLKDASYSKVATRAPDITSTFLAAGRLRECSSQAKQLLTKDLPQKSLIIYQLTSPWNLVTWLYLAERGTGELSISNGVLLPRKKEGWIFRKQLAVHATDLKGLMA